MFTFYLSSLVFYAVVFSLSSYSFAYQRSKTESIVNSDNKPKVESNVVEELQSNDEQYGDESKQHRASYQHEQELLEKIYAPNRTYVSVHDDHIYPSNFTYFTFNHPGTYRFILISKHGDADLYVSTRDKYVSYDNYEYSSCTCGIDEVFIEYRMKRPIFIGVYGYSQYQITRYRLLIELIDRRVPTDETGTEQSSNHEGHNSAKDKISSTVFVEQQPEEEQSLLWNIFLWLLNVLLEVLA